MEKSMTRGIMCDLHEHVCIPGSGGGVWGCSVDGDGVGWSRVWSGGELHIVIWSIIHGGAEMFLRSYYYRHSM